MYNNELNCSQCGGNLPLHFKHSRLVVCQHCQSTLFIEDDAVRYAGYRSVISDEPSIIQFHQTFSYNNNTYTPIGKIRYRYKQGFWDEWWIVNKQNEGAWLSVDEGEYAFETPFVYSGIIPKWNTLSLNDELVIEHHTWRISELGKAVCEGFLGELPEPQRKGEIFTYAVLSNTRGGIITLEYLETGCQCYMGKWIDHYEITH